jgi:hypothetical protein
MSHHRLLHPRRFVTPIAIVFALSCAVVAMAAPRRPLLAYWAFNCFTTCGDANFSPETVSESAAGMSSTFELEAGTNESGTTLNAVSPYEARAALTLRTGAAGINNGRNLTWRVNASGISSLQVSFATRRSPGGFSSTQFQYSSDGSNFVDMGAPFDPAATFDVVAFDLKHVRELNDNPNAAFRLVFAGGSTASAGEFTLIDNLQVAGK